MSFSGDGVRDATDIVRRLDMFDVFMTTRQKMKLPEGADYWYDAKADIAAEIRVLQVEVTRLQTELAAARAMIEVMRRGARSVASVRG